MLQVLEGLENAFQYSSLQTIFSSEITVTNLSAVFFFQGRNEPKVGQCKGARLDFCLLQGAELHPFFYGDYQSLWRGGCPMCTALVQILHSEARLQNDALWHLGTSWPEKIMMSSLKRRNSQRQAFQWYVTMYKKHVTVTNENELTHEVLFVCHQCVGSHERLYKQCLASLLLCNLPSVRTLAFDW